MRISAIDVFCGVGGMSHGLLQEGIDVVAGIDVDATCQYAYEKNNDGATFYDWDVREIDGGDLEALYPNGAVRALVGCAPCQPYTKYTNTKTKENERQWRLLREFARLVVELEPDVVSMENVPRLEEHRIFDEFVKTLEDADYAVSHFVADGRDYGIPQRRRRLVLFASRFGPVALIPATHDASNPVTVRKAIGGLPKIAAGSVCETDPLHRSRGLTPRNLKRLRATSEGGGWSDWPDELRLKCHKKKAGKTFRSVYGRMEWDKPAPVITTQCIGIGNGRFGHPKQDRAISLREAALLQSFPVSYDFIDPATKKVSALAIARHIGNAVPPRLGRIVGRSIRRHLEEVHAE